jgi:hypothetical protein
VRAGVEISRTMSLDEIKPFFPLVGPLVAIEVIPSPVGN